MPGRDRFAWVDRAGWTLAALVLAGVLGHGIGRIVTASKRS